MPPSTRTREETWQLVQANRTYRQGALAEERGLAIKWHSPANEQSSQIFCISVFGSLWALPDGAIILKTLFAEALPHLVCVDDWQKPTFEHQKPQLLGETGGGTPTSVDAFYSSPGAAICVESKFIHDAKEGFGGCGQARTKACKGFYGPGSDAIVSSMQKEGSCRLAIADGRRAARLYWQNGRTFFQSRVFDEQVAGESCPFAGSNFQLVRNFLFAAASASAEGAFGVLTIAPKKFAEAINKQVRRFQDDVLLPRYRAHIAATTYDRLADLLANSSHSQSRELHAFLREILSSLS